MSFDLITLIIFCTALVAVCVLVGRKLPRLVSLDVTTIPKERHAMVKEIIIAERLERKILLGLRKIQARIHPFFCMVRSRSQGLMRKVDMMEQDYRKKARIQRPDSAETSLAQIQGLLTSAEELAKAGEYQKAERKYIEVVSIAPNTTEVFKGLGALYVVQKDYAHAEESIHHALKLKPKDLCLYLDLLNICRAQGDHSKALAASQQAAALAPSDPKALDALLEESIMMGERELAERTLAQLVEANPENQKLDGFRAAIAELPSKNAGSASAIKKHNAPL